MNVTNTTSSVSSGPFEKCAAVLNHPLYSGATSANVIVTSLSALVQVALLITLRCRRRELREYIRDRDDLASHLLPLHVGMLRALVAVYLFQALTLLVPMLGAPLPNLSWGQLPYCITRGVVWGMQHVILDGVAILFCQVGIGQRAIISTFQIAIPWGLFTTAMVATSCYYGGTGRRVGRWILATYYIVQTSAYIVFRFGTCAVVKQKRPAFNNYAMAWICLRVLALAIIVIAIFNGNLGKCLAFSLIQVPFIVFVPWIVYSAFRSDTRYWYGCAYRWTDDESAPVDDSKPDLKRSGSDIRQPLFGVQMSSNAINHTISKCIDNLQPADVISFAETSLDVWALLGVGGGAKVYKGRCRKRPVAIKLLFAPDIDETTIERFFDEARILRFLKHPNIVLHYGVCVAPPALCHVLELCEGSLFELIQQRALNGMHFWLTQNTSNTSISDALLTASDTKMEEMAADMGSHKENFFFRSVASQCCSAVAFMHEQKPPIIHRDIKSLNFLFVSTSGGKGWQIKLADMDIAVQQEDSENLPANCESKTNVFGILGTPQWSAPECLLTNDECPPGTKADVFALAVVWWECLTLKMPHEHLNRREIVDLVARKGRRLPLPPNTAPTLTEVFERAWSHDPRERPTAAEMLVKLHA